MRSKCEGRALVVCLSVICSLLLWSVIVSADSAEDHVAVRSFKMPKLFDFARYRKVFNKSYKSIAELAVRQKLFMARAFRAFASGIKYRHKQSSYYLKLNHMSDMSPEEIEATRIKPLNSDTQLTTEQLPVVRIEDINNQLKEVEERRDEPGFREIAVEIESISRKRRQLDSHNSRVSFSLDQLAGSPQETQELPEIQGKIREFVPSNNPNYVDPKMNLYQVERVDNSDTTNDIASSVSWSLGLGLSVTGIANQLKKAKGYLEKKTHPTNKVYVDHRNSGCFFPARNQGSCGSCYSFAYIALLEYWNCKETGELVPFSEQYMVDCGKRISGVNGCSGAYIHRAALFALDYGIELRSKYPYLDAENTCPYDATTDKRSMGHLRPSTGSLKVPISLLDSLLPLSPMVVGIATKGDFHEYGGGVHSGKNCGLRLDHIVLLVGSGREDGNEYWLMRNSHSTAFGEEGYYKLSKSAKCVFEDAFMYGDKLSDLGLKLAKNSRKTEPNGRITMRALMAENPATEVSMDSLLSF